MSFISVVSGRVAGEIESPVVVRVPPYRRRSLSEPDAAIAPICSLLMYKARYHDRTFSCLRVPGSGIWPPFTNACFVPPPAMPNTGADETRHRGNFAWPYNKAAGGAHQRGHELGKEARGR